MPKFAWTVEGRDGVVAKGVEQFESLTAARTALLDRDVEVLEVVEKRSIAQFELTKAKVKRAELMHLSRQLGAFIRAGIPILDAIQAIGEEADSKPVQRLMENIHEDLRSGETLSDSVNRHPDVFPDYYRGILRSAELTGQLDTVLDRLSKYLERDLEAKRKIKSAMIYPAVVAGMSSVTIIVLAVFVLPKFKDFFSSLDAKLPLPTRMLLWMTDFVGAWWWAMVAAVLLVVLVSAITFRTRRGRRFRDALLLRLPAIGDTLKYAIVERFCRVFASMVSAGVPLPEAMRVAASSLNNRVYQDALAEARAAMLEGQGLAGPISRTGLFPGTASQMMRVGEDTGSLDTQLEVAAGFYESELDYKIKRLTTLFEPAVILVMGGIVGFVAIALVSAMYGIFRQVQV